MRHIRSLVGCITIALAAAAHAQSMESLPAGMPDLAAPMPTGAPMPSGPSTRSVFVGTIAALLAQGLGSALSQGLAGSITRWFNHAPPAEVAAPQAMAMPMRHDPVAGGAPHAGVAYEVHAMALDGTTHAVDPAQHVFHTGDQFQIYYRPTLPGRIEVFNINPRGSEARVDTVEVAAGQLAALGPYRFVDAKGPETLKLVLAPCGSPALVAQTRGIVKVGAASGPAATPPALRIADCGDPRMRGIGAKTRTITRTTLAGSTAFALDPLSRSELTSGLISVREVRIALQHR